MADKPRRGSAGQVVVSMTKTMGYSSDHTFTLRAPTHSSPEFVQRYSGGVMAGQGDDVEREVSGMIRKGPGPHIARNAFEGNGLPFRLVSESRGLMGTIAS
jgi:hypothetical protein